MYSIVVRHLYNLRSDWSPDKLILFYWKLISLSSLFPVLKAGELSIIITVYVQVIWLQTNGIFYLHCFLCIIAIQCACWVSTGTQAIWISWLHLLLNRSTKSVQIMVLFFKKWQQRNNFCGDWSFGWNKFVWIIHQDEKYFAFY